MYELTYHSTKLPKKKSSFWTSVWGATQAPSATSPGESESGGVSLLSAFTSTPLASRFSVDRLTRAVSSSSEASNQNQAVELPPQEETESPAQLRRDSIGEMVPIPLQRQNKEQNANNGQERERDEQMEGPAPKDGPISSGHEMLPEKGAQ